jgi:hypothetical protein
MLLAKLAPRLLAVTVREDRMSTLAIDSATLLIGVIAGKIGWGTTLIVAVLV